MDNPLVSSVSRRDLLKLGGIAAAAGAAGSGLHLFDPGSADAQTPKRGGTFRVRFTLAPPHFDPQQTVAFTTMVPLSFTHSRLVRVKAGPSVKPGTQPLEPDLAESWTQPNDTTYIFKLRRGVRWHPKPPVNGREVTAEDVKYTFERFMGPTNPNRGMLEQVDKVEALDKYTVKFTLKEPFAWLLEALASTSTWIIAKEVVEQHGDLKKPETCIGTGPWMLERYEPNLRFTFVRNPNYFIPGLPYADGVDMAIETDPASAFAAWLAGRYDFAPEYGMVVRRSDLEAAKQRKPGLQMQDYIVVFGGITWTHLDQEPFKDVRVRRALAMATNWREVLETNAWSQGRGAPNPAIPAALKDWSIPIDQLPAEGRRLYEFDPAAAKRLLAEVGYASGFKTTLETTAGYGPDYMDAVEVTVAGWKKAGIEAEIKLKEYGAFISSTIFGKFDKMGCGLFGAWTDPDSYLYRTFIPGQALNASGVNDPKLTEMIRLQRRTFNVARRREIIYDIQRYVSQQVLGLYGPSVSAMAAWEPYVKNFGPNIGHDYGGRLMAAWLDR
ncbi:MAG: ABC transporter substrate-binding protein [Candidatus Rokubacteria bacterium]|nr:ABC transporter substrate-binding protein [Candidatus Rokubacteria bacterium]